MEPQIPDWITSDFLSQSLQSDDRYKDITVTNFTASFAAPPGNNYGSLVVRVVVDCKLRGDNHKLSVIVKGPVTEGATGELMKELKNTEHLFYNVFLPEVKKLMEYSFAPNSFQSSISSAVVIEDLKKLDYAMADRIKQLDFEHCCLYMNAAATFHAASAALNKENPEVINTLCGHNLYGEEGKSSRFMELLQKWSLECMANHITDPKISQTVKDSNKHIWQMIVEIHRPNDNFNSLLQFDPWTTNMMFKYDSQGTVCDIMLIDFQNLLFGSPVHDLVFFIWTSANENVRKHRLQDLYSQYIKQLNINLRKLNCREVELDSFLDTVGMFSPFAMATAAFSAVLLDSSPADFNQIIKAGMGLSTAEMDNPLERYYTDHFCQNRLPQLVDNLAAEGVFNYLETKLKTIQEGT